MNPADSMPDPAHFFGPSPQGLPSPQVVCIPSTDGVFAEVVAQALIAKPMRWTWDLQDALRPFYPECRVRARELSGEPGLTWYVYRDWDFPGPASRDEQP
jgi:hypothetical protein